MLMEDGCGATATLPLVARPRQAAVEVRKHGSFTCNAIAKRRTARDLILTARSLCEQPYPYYVIEADGESGEVRIEEQTLAVGG